MRSERTAMECFVEEQAVANRLAEEILRLCEGHTVTDAQHALGAVSSVINRYVEAQMSRIHLSGPGLHTAQTLWQERHQGEQGLWRDGDFVPTRREE